MKLNENGKHPGGRPRKIKDVQALQQKIADYFAQGEGNPLWHPTITGLVISCGYNDINSFYDMEKRKEFSGTVKKARTLVANAYENRLFGQNAAGAIFALKNFGWRDDYQGKPVQQGPAPKFIFHINGVAKEVSTAELLNGR